MPKTAGAARRKVETPAEEHTKLTPEFCRLLRLWAEKPFSIKMVLSAVTALQY